MSVKILIVDDDAIVRESMRGVLVENGYEVETAKDSDSTIKKFSSFSPDLILLDIELKEKVTGIHICQKIHSIPAFKDLPIVFVTGDSSRETLVKAIKAGATDYFVKSSYSVPTLLKKVEEGLKKGGKATPEEVQKKVDVRRKSGLEGEEAQMPEKPIISKGALMARLKNIEEVKALPFIVAEVMRLTKNTNTNIDILANLIKKDQSIMTKVLRVANSFLYQRLGERLYSIDRAIVKIGFNGIRGLTIGISMLKHLSPGKNSGLERIPYWMHLLGCGVIAKNLAVSRKFKFAEDMFVMGLMHDLGKSILDEFFRKYYREVLKTTRDKKIPLTEVEHKLLTLDHSHVGKLAAKRWSLPTNFQDPIGYHHHSLDTILSVKSDDMEAVVMIIVADLLTKARDIGYSGDDHIMDIPDPIIEYLNVDGNALVDVSMKAMKEVMELLEIMLIHEPGLMPKEDTSARVEGMSAIFIEGKRCLHIFELLLRGMGFDVYQYDSMEEVDTGLSRDLLIMKAGTPGEADQFVRDSLEAKRQGMFRECPVVIVYPDEISFKQDPSMSRYKVNVMFGPMFTRNIKERIYQLVKKSEM